MLVKICKKALLVLAIVTLFASAAMAANSALTGGGSAGAEDSLERVLDGGITIVATGVTVDNYVNVFYTVTSEEDTTIKVSGSSVYDNLGYEFNQLYYVDIGNQRTLERLIIGGVPTVIRFQYTHHNDYKVASVYPRVGMTINGQEITFRNVPGKIQ